MKWCLREFRLYEMPAMEAWFQKMAKKGWLIHSINGGNLFCFEKITPARLVFSVKVIGNMSLLSAENCETAQYYREYCEQAGWKFLCSNRVMQVFCAPAEADLVPIETDEKLEFDAVWRQVRKQIISQSILVLSWLFFILYVPSIEDLLKGASLSGRIFVLGLCLFFAADNVRSLVWYFKGRKALKEFRKVSYYGGDDRKSFGTLMLLIEGLILAGFFFFLYYIVQNSGFHRGLYYLLYFAVYLIFILVLQRLIRRRGFRKGAYALAAVAGAIVLTFSMIGINRWIEHSDIPDDLLVKKEKQEWLLTEEDFGLPAAEEDYAYNINDKSFLGKIQEYQIFSDEWGIYYILYETKYDFLRDKLREELLTPFKIDYSDVYRSYITKPYAVEKEVKISAVYDRYTEKETGEIFEESFRGYLLEKEDKLLFLSCSVYTGSLETVSEEVLKLAAEKL